jgi:hypothetical protein
MRPLLAALTVTALALAPVAGAQEEPPRRITVTGEARVEAAPDLASISAGVQSEALQAADALSATGEAMRAVLAAIAAQGVAEADVQTSQLSVDPLWEDGGEGRQPRVRGYAASNVATVRVRDTARLGALIDAVGAAGANRVFGISFEIADPAAQLADARRQAVADARAKAELLAAAAGVALGPVLSIREGGEPGPSPMMARAEMAMDTPIAAGVVGVVARVEIVYAIE